MRGQLRGLEAACAGEVHAALVARLATLESEHAALARDADAQRRQYERCLDDVANQVVRALLSQKVHRKPYFFILTPLFHFPSSFVLASVYQRPFFGMIRVLYVSWFFDIKILITTNLHVLIVNIEDLFL